MTPPGTERRGRKTKEQEARDFLTAHGVDLDAAIAAAAADKDAPIPETFEEMRSELLRIIWRKRNDLGATALTEAMKALAKLSEASSGGLDETPPEPLVADVIDGIAHLDSERKRDILERALADIDVERARIVEVLNA